MIVCSPLLYLGFRMLSTIGHLLFYFIQMTSSFPPSLLSHSVATVSMLGSCCAAVWRHPHIGWPSTVGSRQMWLDPVRPVGPHICRHSLLYTSSLVVSHCHCHCHRHREQAPTVSSEQISEAIVTHVGWGEGGFYFPTTPSLLLFGSGGLSVLNEAELFFY